MRTIWICALSAGSTQSPNSRLLTSARVLCVSINDVCALPTMAMERNARRRGAAAEMRPSWNFTSTSRYCASAGCPSC